MKLHQKNDGNIIRQFYEPPRGSSNDKNQHHSRYIVSRKNMHVSVDTREANVKTVWGSFKSTISKERAEKYIGRNDSNDNNDVLIIGIEPAEEGMRFAAPKVKNFGTKHFWGNPPTRGQLQ